MNFSEWRRMQRDSQMFNISGSFVAEGLRKDEFEKIVYNFLPFVKKELHISQLPKIHFVDDPKFAKKNATFGMIKNDRILIYIQGRQTMDILRTIAHELVHYRQHNKTGKQGSGKAGAPTENEANRIAGTIVRKFGEKHSGLFQLPSVNEARKRKKKMIDIDSEHYPMELT